MKVPYDCYRIVPNIFLRIIVFVVNEKATAPDPLHTLRLPIQNASNVSRELGHCLCLLRPLYKCIKVLLMGMAPIYRQGMDACRTAGYFY